VSQGDSWATCKTYASCSSGMWVLLERDEPSAFQSQGYRHAGARRGCRDARRAPRRVHAVAEVARTLQGAPDGRQAVRIEPGCHDETYRSRFVDERTTDAVAVAFARAPVPHSATRPDARSGLRQRPILGARAGYCRVGYSPYRLRSPRSPARVFGRSLGARSCLGEGLNPASSSANKGSDDHRAGRRVLTPRRRAQRACPFPDTRPIWPQETAARGPLTTFLNRSTFQPGVNCGVNI
jgi:hypothetical protein